ncbi:MAG: response regulator [Oscillatoriales cyanobacterium SM2_1_8]|nr:response regulator [Oscillatoriales cyanobacterium SM2_1_8]
MTLRAPTVAIVDDKSENLELLYRILEREGYGVHPYTSAIEALMAIAASPPDLILSDVYMPDMDGFDFCCHLKADPRTQAIPLLFISAFDDMGSKLRGFEVGGLDYITKPFQAMEILARVRTHLTLYGFQKQLQAERDRAERRTRLLQQELCAQLGNDPQLLFDLSARSPSKDLPLVPTDCEFSLAAGGGMGSVVALAASRAGLHFASGICSFGRGVGGN